MKTFETGYEDFSTAYKVKRMSNYIRKLEAGLYIRVDDICYEEVAWLKSEYGSELVKVDGIIMLEWAL